MWSIYGSASWDQVRSGQGVTYIVTQDGLAIKDIVKGPWYIKNIYNESPLQLEA